MARIKVKVVGSGKPEDPFRVNLPTYVLIGDVAEDKTAEVEIPDDECKDGKPDKAKIRAKYKGQPRWDREDVLSDV